MKSIFVKNPLVRWLQKPFLQVIINLLERDIDNGTKARFGAKNSKTA